jgi:hypothetical protein
MNSPRKMVLYATDAMCMVCEAGSLGQKSSEALTTALLFELQHDQDHVKHQPYISRQLPFLKIF